MQDFTRRLTGPIVPKQGSEPLDLSLMSPLGSDLPLIKYKLRLKAIGWVAGATGTGSQVERGSLVTVPGIGTLLPWSSPV